MRLNFQFKYQHLIFLLFLVTLLFAFIMPDRKEMLSQYITLVTGENHLLQDSFYIGASGAFFNTSTLLLLVLLLSFDYNHQRISGIQLSALGLFIGHSFFGLDLLNTLPILLGIRLYAKWTQQSFKRFISVSLFSCAAGPIISYIVAINTINGLSLLIALIVGLIIGFISPPLAEHFIKFHQGFSLYNFGFTTGIISMFVILFFKYFNLTIEPRSIISVEYHHYLFLYYLAILLITFLLFFKDRKDKIRLRELFRSSGRVPDDFFAKYNQATVALNIFITGIVYLVIILFLGIPFSGPVLGALLSLLGFCSFGKHLFNTLPTSVGVLFASIMMGLDLDSITVALPLIFATALAPISGYYGIISGILAGFLHMSLVNTLLPLHQGMNLFNNGFTSGFVAAFIVPIIEIIKEHQPNK